MHVRRAVNLLASVLIVVAIARLIARNHPSAQSSVPVEANQQPRLCVYDVRDIWQPLVEQLELRARAEAMAPRRRAQIDYAPNEEPVYDPPAPTTAATQGLFNGSGAVVVSVASKQEATDQITAMLSREVTHDQWYDNGGSTARFAGAKGGFLMIWHTAAGHRQIEALLTAIRHADQIRWQESGGAAK